MTTDRAAPTAATPAPEVPGDLAVDLAVGLAPQAAPASVDEPVDTGCGGGCCAATAPIVVRDDGWHRAARAAVWLSWASLGWMTVEGAVGLLAGFRAGSTGLVGWALSSVVEGLASIIVIWRLTGTRTLSDTSERTAQRAVAVSFWLLAPYVAVQATHDLLTGSHPRREPGRHRRDRQQHAGDASTGPGQAPARCPARLDRHRRRGHPEPAVRLPCRRGPGRARRQCCPWCLVAGPARRARRRRGGGQGRARGLAR